MTTRINRPLSPHLQVYRWTLTMAMSILHRATGFALYAGTILLAWGLLAVASGPTGFATFKAFIGSWFGLLVLFGYTWALVYHLLSGLRHLVWDLGYAFGEVERFNLSRLVAAGSVVLTLLIWIVGFTVGGGR
jgi:succinate dehydrogenase / fumarate reductase cytochrome b subunit